MPYAAPLADMRLVLDAVGGLSGEAAELAGPVLEEAARCATKRRAMGRALPHHRPEDLHHLWRPRPDRQHHSYGAGAHPRRAARQPRDFAVPRPEIPAGRRGTAG